MIHIQRFHRSALAWKMIVPKKDSMKEVVHNFKDCIDKKYCT